MPSSAVSPRHLRARRYRWRPLRHHIAAQKTQIAAGAAIPGAAHYKEVNAAKKAQKPP
jgi:hypothetical protein